MWHHLQSIFGALQPALDHSSEICRYAYNLIIRRSICKAWWKIKIKNKIRKKILLMVISTNTPARSGYDNALLFGHKRRHSTPMTANGSRPWQCSMAAARLHCSDVAPATKQADNSNNFAAAMMRDNRIMSVPVGSLFNFVRTNLQMSSLAVFPVPYSSKALLCM